jgi:hypothetical protein
MVDNILDLLTAMKFNILWQIKLRVNNMNEIKYRMAGNILDLITAMKL